MEFWERRYHFIGNFGKDASFYWLFERGGAILLGKFWIRLVDFFHLCPKLKLAVGWSFILWSMLYLEGWSSRSSLFYWCGLMQLFLVILLLNTLFRNHNAFNNHIKLVLQLHCDSVDVGYQHQHEKIISFDQSCTCQTGPNRLEVICLQIS